MSSAFFEQPILNSPYEPPAQHWELDGDGQPTSKRVAARRDRLAPLDRLAEPNWQEGQVVSLSATGTTRIGDLWTPCNPAGLDLGLGPAQ